MVRHRSVLEHICGGVLKGFNKGKSRDEANHLCEEIVSVYEDLKEDKGNLGRLPKKWLAFLEEVIEGR